MLEPMLSRVPVGTGSDGIHQLQGEDLLYMLEGMLISSRAIVSGSRTIVGTAVQPHRQTSGRSLGETPPAF
jgi:hypothetical protein